MFTIQVWPYTQKTNERSRQNNLEKEKKEDSEKDDKIAS